MLVAFYFLPLLCTNKTLCICWHSLKDVYNSRCQVNSPPDNRKTKSDFVNSQMVNGSTKLFILFKEEKFMTPMINLHDIDVTLVSFAYRALFYYTHHYACPHFICVLAFSCFITLISIGSATSVLTCILITTFVSQHQRSLHRLALFPSRTIFYHPYLLLYGTLTCSMFQYSSA